MRTRAPGVIEPEVARSQDQSAAHQSSNDRDGPRITVRCRSRISGPISLRDHRRIPITEDFFLQGEGRPLGRLGRHQSRASAVTFSGLTESERRNVLPTCHWATLCQAKPSSVVDANDERFLSPRRHRRHRFRRGRGGGRITTFTVIWPPATVSCRTDWLAVTSRFARTACPVELWAPPSSPTTSRRVLDRRLRLRTHMTNSIAAIAASLAS